MKPSQADLVSAFGEHSLTTGRSKASGNERWRVRVQPKDFGRLREMMAPAWRVAKERGRKVEAQVPKVTLQDGTQVASWTAEAVCKRTGMREHVNRRFGPLPEQSGEAYTELRCGHSRWMPRSEVSAPCPYGCGAQMRTASHG